MLGIITGIMTLLLSSIAGISLLVGGVGIMNIMLVSVTERTREIGIRLAVGDRGRDILRQFLIESTLLSCIGGVVGIFLGAGFGGSHLAHQLADQGNAMAGRRVVQSGSRRDAFCGGGWRDLRVPAGPPPAGWTRLNACGTSKERRKTTVAFRSAKAASLSRSERQLYDTY